MTDDPYTKRDEKGRFLKGSGFWTGKKREPFSDEWRAKMGRKKQEHPLWGKHHSEDTKEKIKNAQIGSLGNQYGKLGPLSANWKGGRTQLHQLIRNSNTYVAWRTEVFVRDEFTCQECGCVGVELNAHHLNPFALILDTYGIKDMNDALNCESLWDTSNGQTLCVGCHDKTKTGRKLTYA